MTELAPSAIWARVQLARHPERPHSLDYIRRLASDFEELHGDRLGHDDAALVAGLGSWDGTTVMFIGQQKGRFLHERNARNYGMMHPEGYRKAMRVAALAAKFRFPIVTLVDTPGAFPGAAAEQRGIAIAIATAIKEWFQIGTPVVSAIIGEGGSGGALGLAVADRVIMLRNAIYSVASPEACASIIWRNTLNRVEAAEELGLVPERLLDFGVIDEVVSEPSGGAHTDHDLAAQLLGEALSRHLRSLSPQSHTLLLRRRYERFRNLDRLIGSRPG
jgi:acetyl-CoA carboxylase carboxyl transferase subunit alpha